MKKLFLLAFVIILITVKALEAGVVTLAWDPPGNELNMVDMAGFYIYYGCTVSGQYDKKVYAGLVARFTIDDATLLTDRICYFAATTYGTNGLESNFSNEAFGRPRMSIYDGMPIDDWFPMLMNYYQH